MFIKCNTFAQLHINFGSNSCLILQLMIPYRNDGQLTPRMRTHNYYLSRCRSIIERSFALLKGKWRRLKYFPNYCVEYAVDHIIACVVLHNFIILEGNAYEVCFCLFTFVTVSVCLRKRYNVFLITRSVLHEVEKKERSIVYLVCWECGTQLQFFFTTPFQNFEC